MPLGADPASDLPTPWGDRPLQADPLDSNTPKPANLPPATSPRSLGIVKQVQNDLVDYKIDAEVIADGSGGVSDGAKTSFSKPTSKAPGYRAENGKITKFEGKFTFKGTVQIQTSYAANSNSKTLSCYGRGTTTTDVTNRDITLGFHESCHHVDYEAYLKANAPPDPPTMSVGMDAKDYDKSVDAFIKAVEKYWTDMTADSVQKTDEVGFTLSKSNRTNTCYVHEVP